MSSLTTTDQCPNGTCTPSSVIFGHKLYFDISCIFIGLAILCTNSVVIYTLYQRWRHIRRGKRFAFALNLAISDFLIGPVLVSFCVADMLKNDSFVLMSILQVMICFNIQLTTTNFSCFLLAQYFAIKHPLYYRTRFSTKRVIGLIGFSWTFSGLFTCAKYFFLLRRLRYDVSTGFLYFPHIEQVVRNCLFLINTFSFGYVFLVALIRKRRHSALYYSRTSSHAVTRQNSQENESFLATSSDPPGQTGTGGSLKRGSHSFTNTEIRNYRSIVAAGARLLIFFLTSIPYNAYYCYFLLTHHPRDFVKAYLEVKGVIASLVILWFFRAVADPLITLISEKSIRASVPDCESRNSSLNSSKIGFGNQTRQHGWIGGQDQ